MSLTHPAAASSTGRTLPAHSHDAAVGRWLILVCLMILGQVLIGGITRLTGSGLSIMEWKPIIGGIPPLNEAQWNHVFALYQQTMQFKHINSTMDIVGFKGIFWWEFIHRLWARLIGVVFLLPFLWFWFKGWIRKEWRGRLIAMFVLGGLQGLMGWVMVASGFEDRTSVSQYRLAAHLVLALIIYGYIFWAALELLQPAAIRSKAAALKPGLARLGCVLVGLISLEITIGAFVAGLHGGLIYNNFPMMGEHFIADDLFFQSPWWINFFENPGTAQFLHRVTALIVTLVLVTFVIRLCRAQIADVLNTRAYYLILALLAQVSLGISTLILVVPVPLAVAHQGGAIVLLTVALYALHGLKRVEAA